MEGARKKGFQRGMIQGGQAMLVQLYQKNRLTLEEAAEEAKMTVEEFRKLAEHFSE